MEKFNSIIHIKIKRINILKIDNLTALYATLCFVFWQI